MYCWNYVVANQDALCHAPWRVPSKKDIIDIDIALGGTGENQTNTYFQIEKYFELGFIFSGRVNANNTFTYFGEAGYMLSTDEADPRASNAQNKMGHFGFTSQGWNVYPNNEIISTMTKDNAIPVRCVKEIE